MALVLGLDIGTKTLTGALFSGTSKRFRLVDFFREEIPSVEASARPPVSGQKAEAPKDGAGPGGKGGAEGPGGAPAEEYVAPLGIEELIQKVLAERNLSSADVVVALDAKDCVIREIPVAFTREEQIAKVISFEAENYLPTLNMEEFILEYLKVSEFGGKSQVVLFASRQELIEARLAMLKRAGVDPVAIDIDATALFNAYALSPLYDARKSTLLVDMGATSTKIVLVEGGALRKVRAFRSAARVLSPDRMIPQPVAVGAGAPGDPGGGLFGEYSIEARFREIENALRKLEPAGEGEGGPGDLGAAEDLDATPIAILSDEDFERVQALGGDGDGQRGAERDEDRASGADTGDAGAGRRGGAEPTGSARESGRENGFPYQGYLERVGLEIQRTLATSRTPVELICLTGGMSGREEARRYFSEELDVETIQLDFGDSLPSDLEGVRMAEVSQYGAVAVGLAVKELGRDLSGLDFRKGRFRYEHRFTKLKFPLLVLSVMAFFFFLQTAFWGYHEYERLSNRAAFFDAQMRAAYKEFFGKPCAEGRSPKAGAEDQKNRWKGKGAGDMGKVVPYVEAVRDFAQVMNGVDFHFTIKSMAFNFRVKSAPASGGKRGGLKGDDSTVTLITSNSAAHLAFEKKFKEPASRWFEAKGSSSKTKDEYTVTITLTPKASVLAELE